MYDRPRSANSSTRCAEVRARRRPVAASPRSAFAAWRRPNHSQAVLLVDPDRRSGAFPMGVYDTLGMCTKVPAGASRVRSPSRKVGFPRGRVLRLARVRFVGSELPSWGHGLGHASRSSQPARVPGDRPHPHGGPVTEPSIHAEVDGAGVKSDSEPPESAPHRGELHADSLMVGKKHLSFQRCTQTAKWEARNGDRNQHVHRHVE